MRQAIVTGATGFIGSAFVRYLSDHGVEVISLGRRSFDELEAPKRARLGNSRYLQIDMQDIAKLPAALAEHRSQPLDDCVFFNLAWGGVSALSDLDLDAQMRNVVWAVDAVSAAHEMGCTRFIHVGTMEEAFTYKYLALDWHDHKEYNRHVIYSVAKIAAKHAVTLYAESLGIDLIYVLHSHVMGAYDDKDSFLQTLLNKLIKEEPLVFSTGEQMFDVVSVEDCVLGYYLICTRGVPGKEYWVGSGEPRPLKEYIERMYRLYPSAQALQFGKMPYNDVRLSAEDFSIDELTRDTGYMPKMSYEETVRELHRAMFPAV
jgi:nucleoside-diphosphate-sugar epimerase